ncbi:MAG: hypothetical protein VX246_05060, partial [Myxococcota bacterium]|nr:hypothetical protein [Myxococcota bacterium]
FDWLGEDRYRAWYDPAAPGVRASHDKAFAAAFAGSALRDVIAVYSPEDLAEADHAIRDMTQRMAEWREPMRTRFCLKPRFGSSGRGRVAGTDGDADTDVIRGALARLAASGGAVLEPWLDRTHDLSVALYLEGGDEPLSLLGSLDSITTPHGVPVGHCGEIDSRGRIYSHSAFDDDVRAAAAEIATAALAQGFRGPCGVDAFVYESDGGPELRPVCEFNARFTMGIVALGALRRARADIKAALEMTPGDRAGFVFAASHRPGWSSARATLEEADPGPHYWAPLATTLDIDPEHGPGLLATRNPDGLRGAANALRAGGEA